MVDYMSMEEQVDADFSRARRRASFSGLMARLRGDPALVAQPCFGEVGKTPGARGGGVRLGPRAVRLEDMVGSVGRCSEFDRAFLPTTVSTRENWKRVDRAFHRAEELPPVSLYEIGGSYFVLDGNHRVSVYRYHGVEWVDAHVTELGAQSVLGSPPRTSEGPWEGTMPDEAPGIGATKEVRQGGSHGWECPRLGAADKEWVRCSCAEEGGR